jgi:rubrerythrin
MAEIMKSESFNEQGENIIWSEMKHLLVVDQIEYHNQRKYFENHKLIS